MPWGHGPQVLLAMQTMTDLAEMRMHGRSASLLGHRRRHERFIRHKRSMKDSFPASGILRSSFYNKSKQPLTCKIEEI